MKKQILTASIVFKLFIALFSVISLNSFSQQTINVGSHSALMNGLRFDYSIGEMTLVSTDRNANLIVTQGLLQPVRRTDEPNSSGSGANAHPGKTNIAIRDMIKVYPNPTKNMLFVESIENTSRTYGTDISYQLFDATGNIVISETLTWKAGPNKFSLDLKNYAAGAYYLMIHKPNAQGTPENFSYKIQKTN